MQKVLIVEDDLHLRETTSAYLSLRGFNVVGASNEQEMSQALQKDPGPTVILLDVMLGNENGFEIAKKIRTYDLITGIIILTSLNTSSDHVTSLESGADGYLCKPVDFMVLEAKIKATFKRVLQSKISIIKEKWKLNTISWELQAPDGKAASLTVLEKNLLIALTSSPGETVTFAAIAAQLEGVTSSYNEHRIAVLVNRLRRKVKEQTGSKLPVLSNRSQGYSFNAEITIES